MLSWGTPSFLATWACSLRLSAETARGTIRALPALRRLRTISAAMPAATAKPATSWEARSPIEGTSSRLSVRRPSIQKRPAPYQMAYSRAMSPSKRRFFM